MLAEYKHKVYSHFSLLDMDPRLKSQLINTIFKWYESSGPEYAVNRLKEIKLCLLHMWAGDQDYLVHAPWFKRSRDGKGLAGPFRHLFKQGKPAHKRYALAVCNVARVFTPTAKILDRKKEESIKFITEPYRGGPVLIPSDFNTGMRVKSPSEKLQPNIAGFNTAKPKGNFPSTGLQWLDSLGSTLYSELPYQQFLDSSAIKPKILSFMRSSYFGSLNNLTTLWTPDSQPKAMITEFKSHSDQNIGKLSFITTDGACKVRTICLPISEAQVVLLPMHSALADTLRSTREDCTYNQEEGATWAHEQLSLGHTIHSIDLKSATERFPRSLQLEMAGLSGLSDNWCRAFESFAGAAFEIPVKRGQEPRVLSYAVGQPMGLYASFPLLSFGQHGLVRLAAYNCKRSYKNRYRVLGDDVIISDDIIAKEYRALLEYYDIPVSEAKCLTSDKLAEFAGFVIDSKGPMKGVKPPKGDLDLGCLLNYVKTLGRIPPTLKGDKEVEVLATALTEHGGLGLNPKGLTKEERSLFFDSIRGTELDQDLELVKSFDNIRSAFSRALYANSGTNLLTELIFSGLQCYLESLEMELEEKLVNQFPTFCKTPGFIDQARHIDPSFLIGVDPFNRATIPITRKWVRKKYPYFYMLLHEELAQTA